MSALLRRYVSFTVNSTNSFKAIRNNETWVILYFTFIYFHIILKKYYTACISRPERESKQVKNILTKFWPNLFLTYFYAPILTPQKIMVFLGGKKSGH